MARMQHFASRVKLRDLQILMEVVAAGSMGKAANRLHVSQPVISKAIAGLEQALGCRVLDRSASGIALTEHGKAALKCGSTVFDDLRKGIEEINSIADPGVGEVRIGCVDPEFHGITATVIERLAPRYPRMTFQIIRVTPRTLVSELESRNVDFSFYSLDTVITSSNIDVEFLYEDPVAVVVGSNNPLAKKRRVRLEVLAGEPWLLPLPPGFVTQVISEAFQSLGLKAPQSVVACTSVDRLALLSSGYFVTAVPGVMLQRAAQQQVVKRLPIQFPGRHRICSLIILKGRSLGPAAQLFIDELRLVASKFSNRNKPGKSS